MQILVVGRGGREHALCETFKRSPLVSEIFVAPGNPGMAKVAKLLPYDESDHDRLVQFALEQSVDLVLIGPEKPLVDGLADAFLQAGIKVFAPSQKAALIEGSKSFAKELMIKYGIPTGDYQAFTDYAQAKAYLDRCSIPIVIKADGLAAGKGVVVALTRLEAEQALQDMLLAKKFGAASARVIIEEYLEGEEFSLMALVKDDVVVPLDVAQDHKRAYDGDQGPNTGGMGAYSPVPQIRDAVIQTSIKTILEPTAKALLLEGRPFTGVLYAGLILTKDGPKVIEFNARFGDPETQVLLPRLESDLARVLLQVLAGEKPQLKWKPKAMVGIVAASKGYPEASVGGVILPELEARDDLRIYYGGVSKNVEGRLISNGGRVFLVASLGETLEEAQKSVYSFLSQFEELDLFYRKDIAERAIGRAVST